jgi:hypothetical protein
MLVGERGRKLAEKERRDCRRDTFRAVPDRLRFSLAIVSKHVGQIESKEPSLFDLCGKKGGSVRAIVRPLSGKNFQHTRALSIKMFN